MTTPTKRTLPRALVGTGALLWALGSCSGTVDERQLDPATLVLTWPAGLGDARRPLVEFPHGEHTEALAAEGCSACHAAQADGRLALAFKRTEDPADADALMELYHAECTGCHRQRAARGQETGPVLCGQCHAERAPATPLRAPAGLDLGLHARHVAAEGQRCDGCHHVYDEASGKPVYRRGQEDACRDCHGVQDRADRRSLRSAAHAACVGCHHARLAKGQETGPDRCDGCHDPVAQTRWKRPAEPPRLMRGQPTAVWLEAEGAESGAVPFDHQQHERLVSSCSACHHQTMKACRSCHTLTGVEAGGFVSLEEAYHDPERGQSCVGCHAQAAAAPACAGCHAQLPAPPRERGCTLCHLGEAADTTAAVTQPAASGAAGPVPGAAGPAAMPAPVQLAALPALGDDFPLQLRLDRLADRYGPSQLPHGKIVARLDGVVRQSALAARFHASTEVLCAGCHHHSPVGTRPPPCAACHDDRAAATVDRPGLKAAYHRQCMGCHEEMGLKNGCTDCHAEVKR